MFKKFGSLVCAVAICLCFSYTTIEAEDIMPRYSYFYSINSSLLISGTTAECNSVLNGYNGITTQIDVEQTLQKKGFLGIWVNADNWISSVNSHMIEVENTAYGLDDGTYRLKTVFTVYSGSASEEVTAYSTEQDI